MSTKVQRANSRKRKTTIFHSVAGYGAKADCGLPWSKIIGATNLRRMATCRKCLREWQRLHGGVRQTRGGMWSVEGRRYRSLRLALLSTGWA